MEPTSGLFWLPATPDDRVPGTLSLNADGWPEVKLLGELTPSMEVVDHNAETGTYTLEPADDPPQFVVHGFVDSTPRAVSLFRCYTPRRSELGFVKVPIRSQTVRGTYLLRGHEHIDSEDTEFDSMHLRVLGIDAWAALPGFDFSGTEEDNFSVRYKEPEPPSQELHSGGVLRMSTEVVRTAERFREGRIRRSVWLTVSGVSMTWNQFGAEYETPLVTYLRFAMDRSVPMTALRYRRGDETFDAWHLNVKYERDDEKTERTDFLLPRAVADLDVVASFLDTYARTAPAGPVLADLLTGGSRQNLETMVLELTTLAEGLHQRLYPDDLRMPEDVASRIHETVAASIGEEDKGHQEVVNSGLRYLSKPSYKNRLKRLWKEAQGLAPEAVGDERLWVREVNEARNSFAHRNAGFSTDSEIDTFVALVESLRWVLMLLMLRDSGIPEATLADRMQDHQRYMFSLQTMRKYRPDIFDEVAEQK